MAFVYNDFRSKIWYSDDLVYGYSFLNGGMGGNKTINETDYSSDGGFGGGSASLKNICGSGGGYSGGSEGESTTGSGGGSYSSEKMNIIGYNNGMGYVNIKYLG